MENKIQIEEICGEIIYVGKIKDVGAKSFALDTYSTELQKTGIMNIEFAKVRYVQIHTDYLDSLSLLIGKEKRVIEG